MTQRTDDSIIEVILTTISIEKSFIIVWAIFTLCINIHTLSTDYLAKIILYIIYICLIQMIQKRKTNSGWKQAALRR